jgi:hypothetical protein
VLVALVSGVFLWLSFAASRAKGMWYDEVWTLFVTQHDLGLFEIIRLRWLTDIHPPLYYALGWLTRPIAGDSIQAARGLNLAGLALAGLAMAQAVRVEPKARGFALALVLGLIATPQLAEQIIEHRAACLILAANAAGLVTLYAILSRGRDAGPGDAGLTVALGISVGAALNLHYLASVANAALYGAMLILLWRAGLNGWARRLLLIMVAGMVMLVGWYAAQHLLVRDVARVFWVNTSPGDAVRMFYWSARKLGEANLALTALAVFSAVAAVRSRGFSLNVRFAIATAAGVMLALAALFAINWVRPALQERYLIALVPFALAVPATLIVDWLAERRWVLWLVAAGSVLGIIRSDAERAFMPGWEATAARAAVVQRACPDTSVHARPHWVVTPDQPMILDNEPSAFRYGQTLAAAKSGLRLEPVSSRRVSATCPTLVWAEHLARPVTPAEVARQAGLNLSAQAISDARMDPLGKGLIVAFPPVRVP